MAERNLPLTGHLDELRKVIIRCLIAIVITFSLSYIVFGDFILNILTTPLKELDVDLVYIGMTEAFMTKIKLAFLAGIILALPIILWQLWSFLSPALYSNEKRAIVYLLPIAMIMFAVGAVFAYLVVFNYAARFLLTIVNGEVKPMLSVSQYVSFLISFLLPFGLVFELPLVVFFLTKIGLISHHWLVRHRKMAIMFIVIMAAILTPGPDVISQALLAGPMMLLYEISILVARVVGPKERQKENGALS